MNSKSSFSVILSIICSENPSYLDACLASLYGQTLQPNEIIIVEEGTLNQDLYTVISKWKKRFDKLSIINVPQNFGFPAALNEAIKNCNNDLIARMDTDDICFPERFEKQVEFMLQHETIDCVGSWAIEINERGEHFFLKKMPQTHQECFFFFKKRDCLIHPTVLFRKTYFEKCGFYPLTSQDEDTLMWALGFKNGCIFSNIQEPLLYFRLNHNFFSRRRGWKRAISLLKKRIKINMMLHYSIDAYVYALGYFLMRLFPSRMLNFVYKRFR